jgi:NAD(P)H-nitrite reductase large subunit
VVLLGRFRAECQVRMKVVPQQSFVKLLLHDGKLIGAVLIGDTDLEEVIVVLDLIFVYICC